MDKDFYYRRLYDAHMGLGELDKCKAIALYAMRGRRDI